MSIIVLPCLAMILVVKCLEVKKKQQLSVYALINLVFSAEMYSKDEKNIFVEAKKFGIHRTVHAGEGGPAANVIAVS